MSPLFQETKINGMVLNNRFVRSATWEGLATEDGMPTPRLIQMMHTLAQGGIGLIISSHAYIRPDGQAGIGQLGIYQDELIAGLRQLTSAVHHHGTGIVAQIAHAGYFANEKLTGSLPLAFSAVEGYAKGERREMTPADIHSLVSAFIAAGRRARDAGFDGVQIHAAHGYLLSQSLSPVFNQRKDAYGGSLENRARMLLEVLAGLRRDLGKDYPLLVKLNCEDFIEGGLTLADALQVGQWLQAGGIDAIELSGGTFISGPLNPSRDKILSEEKEAYFRQAAKRFKETLQVPIILVGGIRSFPLAETLLAQGVADYFSMSRPLICEPDLVQRWQQGDLRKAVCVSDNQCFVAGRSGDGIYCVVQRKKSEKSKS